MNADMLRNMLFDHRDSSDYILEAFKLGCKMERESTKRREVINKEINRKNIAKAKIKTKGMQVFNVPNTDEGNAFMKQLSAYLNRSEYSLKRRGRGTRKGKGNRSDIPLKDAEWVAVYLTGANVDDIHDRYYANYLLQTAKKEIQELKNLLSNARKHLMK